MQTSKGEKLSWQLQANRVGHLAPTALEKLPAHCWFNAIVLGATQTKPFASPFRL